MQKVAVVCALIALLTSPAIAEEPVAKIALRVTLDHPSADILRSALARELRAFPDIAVVDEREADHELRVVALAKERGIAASVVLLAIQDVAMTVFAAAAVTDPKCLPSFDQMKSIRALTRELRSIDTIAVFTDSSAELLAKRIAASIDVNDIELHRQARHELRSKK